jgi:hypothetical protein
MTIRAARLDANDIYVCIDELADQSQLTGRHLPAIEACDLPAGKYRWLADAANAAGGAFWPVAWLDAQASNIAAIERQQTQKSARAALLESRLQAKLARQPPVKVNE